MDLEKLCSWDVKIGNGLGWVLSSFTFILTNVGILLEFFIACVQVGENIVSTTVCCIV